MKTKVCSTDRDCKGLDVGRADGQYSEKGACLQHMWNYGSQHESGKGCWDISVCNNANGNSSYTMFDGRLIQWFCTDE